MTLLLQFITVVGTLHSVEGTLREKCMTMSLQFITAVDKVNSVDGTLRGKVYDTDTIVYYCCR